MEPARTPSLGELMIQRGLISAEDLEIALAEHLASGRRLGEILVEQGHLDADGLEGLLDEQLRTGAGGPAEDTTEADDGPRGGARGIDLLRERLAAAEAELTRYLPEGVTDEGPAEVADEVAASEPEPAADMPGVGEPTDGEFVLFVATPSGYQLIERSGPVPTVGDEVGVSGALLVVAKVGASPLPGDLRRCAYLEAPS